jgi:hypothetical protein
MLTTLHNRKIFLAPLLDREAVFSSGMEGTISMLDEILQYEAESGGNEENEIEPAKNVLSFKRALRLLDAIFARPVFNRPPGGERPCFCSGRCWSWFACKKTTPEPKTGFASSFDLLFLGGELRGTQR